MKYLITAFIAIAILTAGISLAFSADYKFYSDAVVTTTLKKKIVRPAVTESVYDGEVLKETVVKEPEYAELELDLDFPIYSEMVMMDGTDVTYSYRQHLEWEGREVMVLLDAQMADVPKVKKHKGYIGENWDNVKSNAKYKQHYPVTKAEALATEVIDAKTSVAEKVPYTGPDAAESVPMYQGMCKSKIDKK